MAFYLQFRDGPSDEPIQEIHSPLPLPVPRKGERVELYAEAGEPRVGYVHSVMWGYQPGAPDEAGNPSMDFLARVWLSDVKL